MQPDVPAERRFAIKGHFEWVLLWLLVGYYAICSITIPFINAIWFGELPVLAAIQLPKILPAGWLREKVVMELIGLLGWSRGSFSPDYIMARPYGLAIAYLLPVGIVLIVFWLRNRKSHSHLWRWSAFVLVAVALLDYVMTLVFADQRFLTIY